LEAWDGDNLVAVSVIEEMTDAISALYTFFEPSLSHRSMGSYMIIQLIHHANLLSKPFVYLGYQVDRCNKMNYKQNYYPHERFYQNKWHLKVKKTD
jgi:arginine-tRNA-protein transferase